MNAHGLAYNCTCSKMENKFREKKIRIVILAPEKLQKFGIGISIKLFKDVSEHPVAPLGDSY